MEWKMGAREQNHDKKTYMRERKEEGKKQVEIVLTNHHLYL